MTSPPKPHWARLPKELDIPSQPHRVMPRSKHVSHGCYPCSWVCVHAANTSWCLQCWKQLMESMNHKMQIIRSTHHNSLWGKFPIQEQTRWLRLQFSDFLTCESPISKHKSSVLTEGIKQRSQFARKSWKGSFAHMHGVENLCASSCAVWRVLTRNHKSQMLLLLLTPCR